jgi:hypothetical protein
MVIRALTFVAAAAAMGIVVWSAFGSKAAISPADLTAEAVETQIADLQATLTALAATPIAAMASPAVPSSSATTVIDGMSVTADRAEMLGIVPIGYDEAMPRGVWVAVHFTVTNTTSEPGYFNPTGLYVVDGQGRRFDWNAYATGALTVERVPQQNMQGIGKLQPTFTYEGWIVYDVPADSAGFILGSTSDPAFKVILGF